MFLMLILNYVLHIPCHNVYVPSLVSAFSEEEYRKGIAALKNNKAGGIDDILVEQPKNLGPKAHKWLHTLFNTCFIENKI